MRHVFECGYPVPRVWDASGPDLVMDLVDGPTMLEALEPAAVDVPPPRDHPRRSPPAPAPRAPSRRPARGGRRRFGAPAPRPAPHERDHVARRSGRHRLAERQTRAGRARHGDDVGDRRLLGRAGLGAETALAGLLRRRFSTPSCRTSTAPPWRPICPTWWRAGARSKRAPRRDRSHAQTGTRMTRLQRLAPAMGGSQIPSEPVGPVASASAACKRANVIELGLRNDVYRRPLATALDRLGLREGWRCVDVGAGGGDVTVALAEIVGHDGRVYAVDNDPAARDEVAKAAAAHAQVDRHHPGGRGPARCPSPSTSPSAASCSCTCTTPSSCCGAWARPCAPAGGSWPRSRSPRPGRVGGRAAVDARRPPPRRRRPAARPRASTPASRSSTRGPRRRPAPGPDRSRDYLERAHRGRPGRRPRRAAPAGDGGRPPPIMRPWLHLT